MTPATAVEELRQQVEELEWYHTLELAPGLETPGWFDLREVVDRMPLPPSLEGKRCLDVGTFDGFWAFEMERRGAAEVVAIDVLDPLKWDWPADSSADTVAALARRKARGAGFEVASRELDSSVRRLELSVYDLDPAEVGEFDLVYLGSLLLHLRDPVRALERVRSVCAGTLIVCDAIDSFTSLVFRRRPLAILDGRGRPWWWKPNLAGLARMVEAGGFELVRAPVRLRMTPGRAQPRLPLRARTVLTRAAREETIRTRLGDPHGVVVARRAI